MSFTYEALQIAQKAQSAATLTPMSSFDEEDKIEAQVATEIYEDFVRAELVREPWRFAMMQAELNHVEEEPVGRWTDAWQLPSDPEVLAVRALTDTTGSPIIFDRYNDKLYTNYDENTVHILDYIYRANEANWPPDFRMYVILRMGALFATIITRNSEVAEGLTAQADGYLADAVQNHSQGRTTKKVDVKRITRRRR